MEINYSDILDISRQGLKYRDHQGTVANICFKECAENFKNHVLASGDFDIEDPEVFKKSNSVCVAWRNASAKPKYFEFLCLSPVKVIFPKKFGLFERQKDFRTLQSKLHSVGWNSYDLS